MTVRAFAGVFLFSAACALALDTPVPVVLAPGGVDVVPGTTSNQLSWVDFADNEIGFKVERRGGANGMWSQIDVTASNVLSYQDTGLAAATRYEYRIRAFNDVAHSGYSGVAGAFTYAQENDVRLYLRQTWPGAARGAADKVFVSGDIAYMALKVAGVAVMDVSDPTRPLRVGAYDTSGSAEDVYVRGDYAYVADLDQGGFKVLDISIPASPVLVASTQTTDLAQGIFIDGDHAYLAVRGGLDVFDVSEPTAPQHVDFVSLGGDALDVFVADGLALLARNANGIAVLDTRDPTNVNVLGLCDTDGFAGGVEIAYPWGFVADDQAGLVVVDLSDPTNCAIVGRCDTPGRAREVAVRDQFAYVADDFEGLRAIDISVVTHCREVGSLGGFTSARGLHLSGRNVFVADNGGTGLRVVNISNPTNLVDSGNFDTDGDTFRVLLRGDVAFLADSISGLRVLDISDTGDIRQLAQFDLGGSVVSMHEDGDRLYVVGYDNGLLIFDVSDPRKPRLMGSHGFMEDFSDITVQAGHAYVLDDSNGDLVALNISDPTNVVELARKDAGFTLTSIVSDSNTLYLCRNGGVRTYDVSNPTNLVRMFDDYNDIAPGGPASDVLITTSHVYVADWSGLLVFEKGDMSFYVADVATAYDLKSLHKVGNIIYGAVSDEYGVYAFDVRDPDSPRIVGYYETFGTALDAVERDGKLFVADSEQGLLVMDALTTEVPVGASDGAFPDVVNVHWHPRPGVAAFDVQRDGVSISSGTSGVFYPDQAAGTNALHLYGVGTGTVAQITRQTDSGSLLYKEFLVPFAAPTAGEIEFGGEVDWYCFDVSTTSDVVIKTTAGTLADNYIYLTGPDDWTSKIAEADDGGEGFAATLVTQLVAGTYYVAVRGYSPSEIGTYTIALEVPTVAPTLQTIDTPGADSIRITWLDNSNNEQGFVVERQEGGSGPFVFMEVLPTNTTYFADVGLASGVFFSYRVFAFNEAGLSPPSNVLGINAAAVPAAPSNLVVQAVSALKDAISWVDVSVNETGFEVEARIGDFGEWTPVVQLGAGAQSYTNTHHPRMKNQYRARAVNSFSASEYAYQPGINLAPVTCVASHAISLPSLASAVTLDASCSTDPNHDSVLFYSWREDASNPVIGLLPSALESQPTLNLYLPEPGFYRFYVRAGDGELAGEERAITVYVPGLVGRVELDTAGGFARIPDVRVSAHRSVAEANGDEGARDVAITDSLGAFTLSGIAPLNGITTAWYLRFARPGFETKVKRILMRPPSDFRATIDSPPEVFLLSRGLREHALEGLLTTSNNVAITNATVAILGLANDLYQSTVDADGGFAFRNVPYGSMSLQIQAPGFLSEVREINVRPDLGILRMRLTPGGAADAALALTVRQLGTDQPVPNASVALGVGITGSSDAAGNAGFAGLAMGAYTVTVTAPDHAPTRLPLVTLGSGTNAVSVVLPPTSERLVSGRVTGHNSQPVAGARVGIVGLAGLLVVSDITDRSGQYRLRGVPTGPQVLDVNAVGYAPKQTPITVSNNEIIDVGLARVGNWRAPQRVDGGTPVAALADESIFVSNVNSRVTLDASPSTGTIVEYIWRESPFNPVSGVLPTNTTPTPLVTISSFPMPGVFVFELQVRDATLLSPNRASVSVYVPGLTGNVHASPSDGVLGLGGVEVRAYTSYVSAVAWSASDLAESALSQLDPLGNFTFDALDLGPHWLAARAPEGSGLEPFGPVRGLVTHASTLGVAPINLAAEETRFEGVVLDPDSSPIENVRVVLSLGSLSESFRTSTDANGKFRLDNIPSGDNRVIMFTRNGFESIVRNASIFENRPSFANTLFQRNKSGAPSGKALPPRPPEPPLQTMETTEQSISVSGRVTARFQGIDLPVAQAEVVLGSGFARTFSDADGAFTLSGIPPGAYVGIVRKDGHFTRPLVEGVDAVSLTNTVNTGYDVNLPFRSRPPTLVGQVLGFDGEASAGVSIDLVDTTGRTVAGNASKTDSAGQFKLSGLPEGDYGIRYTFPDGTQITNKVRVAHVTSTAVSLSTPGRIPYAWLLEQFGALTNELEYTEGADPDGDGLSNWREYIANSDPTDPGSVFRVPLTATDFPPVLSIPGGISGRVYRIWWKTNLYDAAWLECDRGTTPGTNAYRLPLTNTPANPDAYFRTEISLP